MKIILLGMLLSLNAFAKDHRSVKVLGSCEKKVTPDRGSLSFSVENQSSDQKEAMKKTKHQYDELKKRLDKLKLENVEFKTTALTIFPVREWERDRLVNKGHKASVTLELETSEISRLGEAMEEASRAGVQNVGSMMSFLSQEKSQQEYLSCLDVAADDARKKAEQLAKKFGAKIADVISVIESPSEKSPQRPLFQAKLMMAKGMSEEAPLPVEAGVEQFSTTLEVIYSIK
jgi:uncharacterized protein